MDTIDLQKTFFGKSCNALGGSLRIISEGIPDHLIQEDHVLYVALKTLAQKKAHIKWCWVILAESECKDSSQRVPLPNLKIEIVQHVSKKQKRELYRSANVFVAHRGWGRETMEAMGLGVPVIQLNNFRLDTFVENGKNCLLVPVNDSKALAFAMERVLIDTDLADHLRVGGTLTACTSSLLDDQPKKSKAVKKKNGPVTTESMDIKTWQMPSKYLPFSLSSIDHEKF